MHRLRLLTGQYGRQVEVGDVAGVALATGTLGEDVLSDSAIQFAPVLQLGKLAMVTVQRDVALAAVAIARSTPPTRSPAASASPAPEASTTGPAIGARSSGTRSITKLAPRESCLSTSRVPPPGWNLATRPGPRESAPHSASLPRTTAGSNDSHSSRNRPGP